MKDLDGGGEELQECITPCYGINQLAFCNRFHNRAKLSLAKRCRAFEQKKKKKEEKEKGKGTFKRENANKRHSVNTMLVSLSSNGM